MILVDVEVDVKEVRRLWSELGKGVDRAAARALNDTMTTVISQGARSIKSRHSALKIGDIKRRMVRFRAHANRLTTVVSVTGKPLSLSLFRPSDKRKAGVTAVIGTRRVLMGVAGRRAFRIPAYGNEYFVRRNVKGRAVKRVRGPSLPGAFRAASKDFERIAIDRWNVAFPSRVRFEIDKAQRRARGL